MALIPLKRVENRNWAIRVIVGSLIWILLVNYGSAQAVHAQAIDSGVSETYPRHLSFDLWQQSRKGAQVARSRSNFRSNIGKGQQTPIAVTLATSDLGDSQSMQSSQSSNGSQLSSASMTGTEVGGTIYNDVNRNGIKDGNEPGIRNVDIEIYADPDGDDWPDGPVLATANSGLSGNYRFSGLGDGVYVMNISSSFFDSAQPLHQLVACPPTSTPTMPTSPAPIDPDNDVDGDNNAVTYVTTLGIKAVRTLGVTLNAGAEPITEDGDPNTNLTVDLCFYNNSVQTPTLPSGEPDFAPEAVDDEYLQEVGSMFAENILVNDTAGNGPLLVRFVSGTIPPGLTLTAGGDLAGTPTLPGVYTFDYEISDYDGDSSTATVTVTIESNLLPVAEDDSLAVNVNETVSLDICENDFFGSGFDSVAYVSGNIAPGLSLTDCILSGIPTAVGTFVFNYILTDTDGDTSPATVTIDVNMLPIAEDDSATAITNTSLSLDLCVNDSFIDGFGSVTFLNGTIPPGMALNQCILEGIPNRSGDYVFEYELADADGDTDTATVTIDVNLVPDAINDSAVAPANEPFNLDICENDELGDGFGSTMLVSGVLPPGLNLDGCVVSGVPTTRGEFLFEYELEDIDGDTDRAVVTVVIDQVGTITIVKQTLGGEDTTFTFNSNDAEINQLRITTSNGEGTSPRFTKIVGTYTISENPLLGWTADRITISGDDDNGSSISGGIASIDLDSSENIVVTFIGSPERTSSACVDGGTDLGGTVWRDFNSNGIRDGNDISFYHADVTVHAFDAENRQIAVTSLRSDGTYEFLDIFRTISAVRVEFDGFPSWITNSSIGADNNTMTQQHREPTCTADLAVQNPSDYCHSEPTLAIACMENGQAPGNTNPAFVTLRYNNPTTKNASLQIADLGAVWGAAYHANSQTVFLSSVVRRHSGFATGPSAIYAVRNGSVIQRINLQGFPPNNGGDAIDLGSVCRRSSTDGDPDDMCDPHGTGMATDYLLPTRSDISNVDLDAFDAVGKVSFGDLDTSEDGKSLWAVNLYQRALVAIILNADGVATSQINHYPLDALPGQPDCRNGVFRPWALEFNDGWGYLGGVCSGENGGSEADLTAHVLKFDPENITAGFTSTLSFALDFTREPFYDATPNPGWKTWVSQWSEVITPREHSQPILSDIAFMADGSMILGFADRFGLQLGAYNWYPRSGSTEEETGSNAGDILYACNIDGTYILEGFAGCIIDNDQGNFRTASANDGPGRMGEFFYQDDAGSHQETSQGALIALKQHTEVVTTRSNPENTAFTSGLAWYSALDGTKNNGFEVVTNGSREAFGKAANLSDVVAMCRPAPIEIGNYVWRDTNNDGIQNPDESGIVGVRVILYNSNDTQIASTTTDSLGRYNFNEYSIPGGLAANAEYLVEISLSQQPLESLRPTLPNASSITPDPDRIDSDGIQQGGYVIASITTAGGGHNNYSVDFGFAEQQPIRCDSMSQEAEDALLKGAVTKVTANDGASGGQHIWVPAGMGNLWNGARDTHMALFCINVPESGRYRIIGTAKAETALDNSFFVTVDGLPDDGYLWDIEISDDYTESYIKQRDIAAPVEVILSAGQHIIGVHAREDGVKLDKVALELVESAEPTPTCAGMEQEAENGALHGNFLSHSQNNASGSLYAGVLNGLGSNLNGTATTARAEYCFTVPQEGTYKLIGTIHAPEATSNSFYVTIDGQPTNGYVLDAGASSTFVDSTLTHPGSQEPVEFELAAGNHTVVIYLREDGAKLDKLRLIPSATVNAAAAQTPDSDYILGSEKIVHGTLQVPMSHELEPALAGHTVTLSGAEKYEATTNHNGRYYVEDVQPGIYKVSVTVPTESGEQTFNQLITVDPEGSRSDRASVEVNFEYASPVGTQAGFSLYLPTIR